MANKFPYLQGLGSALKSQQRSALYGGAFQGGLTRIGESFGRGLELGATRGYEQEEDERKRREQVAMSNIERLLPYAYGVPGAAERLTTGMYLNPIKKF